MIAAVAPASSANLGPGFDVAAIALGLSCRVAAEPAMAWRVTSDGRVIDAEGLEMVKAVADLVAGGGPWTVEISGDIPLARGLGSSASLLVASAAAMRAGAGEPFHRKAIFDIATEVEGHPDNVAAACFGGAVIVGPGRSVHSIEVHPSLIPLVAIPSFSLSTEDSRRALPAMIEFGVATRTTSRMSFLIEGLRTGDPDLLEEAGGDELHERKRASISPFTDRLVGIAKEAGALHAAWSGAGPAVLALVTSDTRTAVTDAWEKVLAVPGGTVHDPGIARTGVVLG